MKYLKVLGLAAFAAMALMAFVGAGTASADTLCKVNTNPCPEGSRYTLPQPISAATAAGVPAVLSAGSFEVRCDSSSSGEATGTNGAGDIIGQITSLTFTNCSGSCKQVKENKGNNLPYNAVATATTGGNGEMTVASGGSGSPGATLEGCTIFNVTCTYGKSEVTLTMEGGNPAHLKANVTLERTGGSGLCPATGGWTADYVVSTPNPVWIEAEP